ncbi:MAG: type III secretion system translocon subunit SctB [Gammaproteobacteria bacterium]
MTTINTHYANPPISGAERIEAMAPPSKAAVATLSLVGGDDGVGRANSDPVTPSALPAPGANSGAGDIGATARHVASLGNSVQADIYAFMGLFFQLSLETRKTASEIRSAEREAKFQELQTAADKIREAANWTMAAGIVTGAVTIAAGAINMAGGIKSLKTAAGELGGMKSVKPNLGEEIELDDLKPEASANDVGRDLADPSPGALQNRAQATNMRFGGVASSVQGTGQIISSTLNWKASQVQAEQKAHEAKAEKDQAQVDMANELFQNMQQTIQDVLSKLAAMEQSSNDTNKQILRA